MGGLIYTSTDSGATWIAQESTRNWHAVASSDDGTKLVAAANPGQIYTSTDSGVTWTVRDSSREWNAVASSADGSKLVAVVNNDKIYVSSDSGVIWTARDSSRPWCGVASSSDGNKLVGVVINGNIYTSAATFSSPVVTVSEDSGSHNESALATSISPGPASESGQTLTFHVSNDNNSLFSSQPDIDPSTGDLTFTPAADANGSATVSVYLMDDGGIANGGDDTATRKPSPLWSPR